MPDSIVPFIVIGGAAYYFTEHGHASPGVAPTPGQVAASHVMFPVSTIGQRLASNGGATVGTKEGGGSRSMTLTALAHGAVVGNWVKSDRPVLDQKLRQAEDYLRDQYNSMGLQARQAGASAINDQFGTHLTGDESWEELSSVAGGVTGGAIGGAIGGPLGAKLGALAGAYLGVKLEEWLSGAWDSIESWASGAWSDVKGAVSGAYNTVVDGISDIF